MPKEALQSPEKIPNLDTLLAQIAKKQNEKFGSFLNHDCSIKMDAFTGIEGYQPEKDKEEIEELEKEWSDANTTNENRLAYFNDLGLNTPEARLKDWQDKKRASENEKLEKIVVGLLNKVLPSNFLAIRTSKKDDYLNKIDTLIIDLETQKVIGAFDEVKGEKIFKRNREKEQKVLQFAKKNGAKVEYGVLPQTDPQTGKQKLEKNKINNLPLFMVSFTKEELNELLRRMNFDPTSEPTDTEKKFFKQIVQSFEEQIAMLEAEKDSIPKEVFENIQTFKGALLRMKTLGEQK